MSPYITVVSTPFTYFCGDGSFECGHFSHFTTALNNLICLYQLVTSFLLFILAGMYLMLEYLNFSSIIKFDIPTKL